jgi:flavodoxin
MNIGIIIHSQTGNTLSVAQKLKEKLSAAGHSVSIQRVSAANDGETNVQNIKLTEKPDAGAYDVLLFGAPVRGFSLSPVMKAYLGCIGQLRGKKTGCFITHYFPYAWMGGNQALGQLCGIVKAKGASVYGTGMVHWSRAATRETQIEAVAGKLSTGV